MTYMYTYIFIYVCVHITHVYVFVIEKCDSRMLSLFVFFLIKKKKKPWKRSKVTKVSRQRQQSQVDSNLPSFVSFVAQFCVLYRSIQIYIYILSSSSFLPLFKPQHAKTEFAVIPALVRVFTFYISHFNFTSTAKLLVLVVNGKLSFLFYIYLFFFFGINYAYRKRDML